MQNRQVLTPYTNLVTLMFIAQKSPGVLVDCVQTTLMHDIIDLDLNISMSCAEVGGSVDAWCAGTEGPDKPQLH